MAVSLPTVADVRKVRAQAVRGVTDRAEVARTPLLAVLGAGDFAVTTVTRAVAHARARAQARREAVQQRVAELPAELRARLNTDEVRRTVTVWSDGLRTHAEGTYTEFAARGEQAWGRIRRQPRVRQVFETFEEYTERLDARVDDRVEDAHDAAETALGTVTRQTRSTGDRAARTTQRFASRTAETVSDLGDDAAEAITEAGDEAASTARSTAHKAADRTAPEPTVDAGEALKPGPTPATGHKPARKPAAAPKTTGPTPSSTRAGKPAEK